MLTPSGIRAATASESGLPVYEECGCCGHRHRPGWVGDCRDDAHRFTDEQLDARHGANNWYPVDIEEVPS